MTDDERASRLVRLYADPRKIRVSVRRDGDAWLIGLFPRAGTRGVAVRSTVPRIGVLRVVALAARDPYFDGLDPSLGWAYEHPQKRRTG